MEAVEYRNDMVGILNTSRINLATEDKHSTSKDTERRTWKNI